MPATDYHQEPTSAATSSPSSFGFSILSRRRDQVHSMDPALPSHDLELEKFQRHVFERFNDLSSFESELLSISWLNKLLETYLSCQDHFNVIVQTNKAVLNKSLMDRYVNEFYERSVKALDVCNAVRDGIEQIRQWEKQLEIVLCAFMNQRSLGEGQFRRAKKALIDLAIGMLDEKESASVLAHRNRSFGRNNNSNNVGGGGSGSGGKSFSHFRSLSWSVSRSWSAARQLQAIGSNLVVPKANETVASNGLNVAVYTMNYVLLFVTWALVAAIPCQDRGLQTHFVVARQFMWAGPVLALHERILEESKKRDRRNSIGLLKEILEIEKCARNMNELTDSVQFPLTEEKEREVKLRVKEVERVYEAVKEGLDPLERQVREVFHRIVRSRTEGLESTGMSR